MVVLTSLERFHHWKHRLNHISGLSFIIDQRYWRCLQAAERRPMSRSVIRTYELIWKEKKKQEEGEGGNELKSHIKMPL